MKTAPLKLQQYGATHGQLVVYFHGAPGAPEEAQLFDLEAQKHGLTVLCLDRFAIHPSITGEAYYRILAEQITKEAGGQPVDFIGFSIGAFIALQTCGYMPNGVRSLHLVSAAAPLEAGEFLPAMAGQQVFRLAKAAPSLFLLLSYWQSLLAWLTPKALFRLLFASAAGADKALATNPEFQARIPPYCAHAFWAVCGAMRETLGRMCSRGAPHWPTLPRPHSSGMVMRTTGRHRRWRSTWHQTFRALHQPKTSAAYRTTRACTGRCLKYAGGWGGANGATCIKIVFPLKVTHVLPLIMAIKVEEYLREDASNPYKQWFDSLSSQAAAKVTVAKLRMELGNTSSIKWFDGLGEYIIDWGPGYRIYLAKDGETLIVLFGGGTKRGQQRDIDKAKELLAEYKSRKKAMTAKSISKHKG